MSNYDPRLRAAFKTVSSMDNDFGLEPGVIAITASQFMKRALEFARNELLMEIINFNSLFFPKYRFQEGIPGWKIDDSPKRNTPCELGLTDKFLIVLKFACCTNGDEQMSPSDSMLKKLYVCGRESALGYDFAMQFQLDHGLMQVLHQAKLVKRTGSNLANAYADFLYINIRHKHLYEHDHDIHWAAGENFQWRLLLNAVWAGAAAYTIGGYVLYGPDNIYFIPIGDLLKQYLQDPALFATSSEPANAIILKRILTDPKRPKDYYLQVERLMEADPVIQKVRSLGFVDVLPEPGQLQAQNLP
ncbi:hypothetical protein EIP91_002976 [Steccherinum ochraceum]|uniref:Uncharacterized protein n=1 Tax=Steccherinum ochraceum TaxID=92696 RepID=A0A4R0RB69_9APHY|nr:hypothetical protein EIP91_002976 [Steccherinum ochraceum]